MGRTPFGRLKMQSKPTALITGIAGQDGSYLAEFLLSQGYKVFGIELPELKNRELRNLSACFSNINIFYGNVQDVQFVEDVFEKTQVDEVYHLAGATFVSYEPSAERETLLSNLLGTQTLLATAKKKTPNCKFFFAGSAEMFGDPNHAPQTLNTQFMPRSVYGIAKLSSHHLVRYYRKHHGLYASTGILYNHESPRRGAQFVTQKIARAAARIKLGLQTELLLGNLNAQRDWGHAADFVRGYWRQLQLDAPTDLIFSTNTLTSVREIVKFAFECVNLNYEQFTSVDPELFRPTEEIPLVGDYSQTEALLNWRPSKSAKDIMSEMVTAELKLNEAGLT